jgi:hypothetical protein
LLNEGKCCQLFILFQSNFVMGEAHIGVSLEGNVILNRVAEAEMKSTLKRAWCLFGGLFPLRLKSGANGEPAEAG